LIATNTFINHQIEGSNFQLGNITENLHRGIWGRGVSGKLKIENQTALSVGVIDNQYNLLERKSFFEEGYTAYAIGEIGNYNSKKSFKTIYAFQDDIYEKITSIHLEGNINKLSIINGHSKPDFSEL